MNFNNKIETFTNIIAKRIAEFILIGKYNRDIIHNIKPEYQELVIKYYNNYNNSLCVKLPPLLL